MLLVLAFILSYLLGSIPSGVWIGQALYHKDVRTAGSHNIGTTNVSRVLGPVAGTIVLAMDILKGTLGASLPVMFGYHQHWLILVCGVAAVVGHTASIFIGFKGGKAVATSAGILLAYNPGFFLIASALFVSFILLTSMVSIASTSAITIVTFISWFGYHDPLLTTIAGVLTVVFFIRHRANFARIRAGKENLVPFGLYYWYRQRHQ